MTDRRDVIGIVTLSILNTPKELSKGGRDGSFGSSGVLLELHLMSRVEDRQVAATAKGFCL